MTNPQICVFLPGAYFGQLIIGVGNGTVTVAHRAVISKVIIISEEL